MDLYLGKNELGKQCLDSFGSELINGPLSGKE